MPTDTFKALPTVPCPNLFKKEIRTITFPGPNGTYTQEPEGTGKCALRNSGCCAPPTSTECWPLFNQPERTDGRWRMIVNNRITQSITPTVVAALARTDNAATRKSEVRQF
jgi:hypothetical protein